MDITAKQIKMANKRAKCTRCGEIKTYADFGKNAASSTGYQSYCKACKNNLGTIRRKRNVSARLRHHFATRIKSQLGKFCPSRMTFNLHKHLGYKFTELKAALAADLMAREGKSLRIALEEGYHIDHIKPLSSYKVLNEDGVDWEEFQRCWAISNLRAIPAEENLAKGAKH